MTVFVNCLINNTGHQRRDIAYMNVSNVFTLLLPFSSTLIRTWRTPDASNQRPPGHA